MKLPSKLKIGAIQWSIIPDTEGLKPRSLRGETEYYTGSIFIDEKMSLQFQQETLLHEIIHALSEGLVGRDELREQQVRHTASMLMQIFKDNKELVEFLFTEESNG